MTPEGKVKAAVKKVIKPYVNEGLIWYDMPVPGGYGKSTLDFFLCIQGKFCAIETKAKGKKPTDRQQTMLDQIERAGGKTFVIAGEEQVEQLAQYLHDIFWDILNGTNHVDERLRQRKAQSGRRTRRSRREQSLPRRQANRLRWRTAPRRSARSC